MKLRLRLLQLILRRSTILSLLPILVAYCFLPGLTAVKFLREGGSEALQIFVYAGQILFPLCAIFWPMGYLHIWVEGETRETLYSYSIYHKSCIGEMLILSGMYILLVFPVIVLSVLVLNASWLEYIRLVIQILSVAGFFYFCAMSFHNVTIGCIPVIGYLFLCFCISDSAEFAAYSIIEPQHYAEQHNWATLVALVPVSAVSFLAGYLFDRFFRKLG